MSAGTITVASRAYAAGLLWYPYHSARKSAAEGARFGRTCWARDGDQAGYAGIESVDLPALAPAVRRAIPDELDFLALVAGDDGVALIQVAGGETLADGDLLFEDAAGAIEAFEARREAAGQSLHATPGLVEGAREFDVAALGDGPAVAAARSDRRLRVVAIVVTAAVVGALWFSWPVLRALIFPPEPEPVAEAPPEPTVLAVVDGGALLRHCRAATEAWPVRMAGWNVVELSCSARFAAPAIVTAAPATAHRPALLVRWTLASGLAPPLHRRLARERLADWPWGSVAGTTAWAVVPLPPVLRLADETPVPVIEVARALDARLGPLADPLTFGGDGEGWPLRAALGRSLEAPAEAIAAIDGLEVLRAVRADGAWRLEGRLAQPETMTISAFAAATEEGEPQ